MANPLLSATFAWQLLWIPENSWTFFFNPVGSRGRATGETHLEGTPGREQFPPECS